MSTGKSKGNERKQTLTPQQIDNATEQPKKTPHYKKTISAQKKTKYQNPTPKKRHPHQLTVKETPAGFEPTKEAFSIHIKVLWGLIYQDSIPFPPDYSFLKEFNTQFSFSEEISNLIRSPVSVSLIPEQDVITLQGVQPGKKKLARGIVNLNDFHIRYVHSLLSRLGIQRWAPDLDNPNFYDPTWFNIRPPGQKTVIADYLNVAFLPNSSASIRGVQHPDEKLSDRKFTEKYWEKVIGPYDISHEIPNEDSDETEGELSDGSDVVSSAEQSEEEEVEEASKEGEVNLEL
ncbi:hypothetical protein O181_069007 [Austropuccinia psidii MF-1]|uniref:Uncharacterized protein n=1 Tax=Austropuccinia psidii MF-1 TaxID=1389203 RepID=A0A9Q3F3H9_9BASI|nr:hypothetical protein [Austropuccinia psidii MF-1]